MSTFTNLGFTAGVILFIACLGGMVCCYLALGRGRASAAQLNVLSMAFGVNAGMACVGLWMMWVNR